MSAEPKVLLEFRNKYGEPAHIVQLANGERRVEAQMDHRSLRSQERRHHERT